MICIQLRGFPYPGFSQRVLEEQKIKQPCSQTQLNLLCYENICTAALLFQITLAIKRVFLHQAPNVLLATPHFSFLHKEGNGRANHFSQEFH